MADAQLTAGGAPYSVHVLSYRDIPFRTVIRQQFDYSCGSAALATLLKFHYGRSVGEAEIFTAMYAAGDQAKIRRLGFSLLDMKRYLADAGMPADGYRMNYAQLQQLTSPAVAVITIGPYKHFVVVKGVTAGHVLVGDPASGLKSYTSAEFTKVWNGVVFAIHDTPDRYGLFNRANEWKPWAAAPTSLPLNGDSLGSITMQAPPLYQITQFVPLSPTGR